MSSSSLLSISMPVLKPECELSRNNCFCLLAVQMASVPKGPGDHTEFCDMFSKCIWVKLELCVQRVGLFGGCLREWKHLHCCEVCTDGNRKLLRRSSGTSGQSTIYKDGKEKSSDCIIREKNEKLCPGGKWIYFSFTLLPLPLLFPWNACKSQQALSFPRGMIYLCGCSGKEWVEEKQI